MSNRISHREAITFVKICKGNCFFFYVHIEHRCRAPPSPIQSWTKTKIQNWRKISWDTTQKKVEQE